MILPIPLFAVVFLSLAPYVSCQAPASDRTLMQVLADIPECQRYREFLLQNPSAQSPPPGKEWVVFCPRNEAVEQKLAAPAGRRLKRDAGQATTSMAALTAEGGSVTKGAPPRPTKMKRAPSPNAGSGPQPRARAKRQVTNVFTSVFTVIASPSPTTGATSTTASISPGGSPGTPTAVATGFRTSGPDPFAIDPNQLTLKTTLNNPAIINLGPGETLPMVSFSEAPASSNPSLKLICGLGEVVNVATRGIPFNLGFVHVAENFVTLPVSLPQSLTELGQNIFLAAITRFNLLTSFENTPRITAFVPIDSCLSGELSECACNQHVVEGPPLYTPDIVLGRPYTTRAGGSITIEINDGVYTLTGGATIVKANVITKNGVVHFINGTISGGCGPKQFTGGSNRVGPWAGGLAGLVGVVVGLLA